MLRNQIVEKRKDVLSIFCLNMLMSYSSSSIQIYLLIFTSNIKTNEYAFIKSLKKFDKIPPFCLLGRGQGSTDATQHALHRQQLPAQSDRLLCGYGVYKTYIYLCRCIFLKS